MSPRKRSGLLGMLVGSLWLVSNLRHVGQQGLVAIGVPLILLILGAIFFFSSPSDEN